MRTEQLPRMLLTGVVSLALIALIAVAQSLMIGFEQRLAPITASGDTSGAINADQFTIEVDSVELAHSVAGVGTLDEAEEPLEAEGTWVVVTATLTSARQPLTIVDPVLLEVADGYTYAGSGEVGSTLVGARLEAGIPVHGAFAVEVPIERLSDPVLRVGAARGDARLSAEAVIDLGLSDDDIARLLDEAATVEIPEPTSA